MASDNRRYLALRKKLDDLNYVMHLDEGSVPLVEKLLAELSKISDHYQSLKKQQQQLTAQQQQQNASRSTTEGQSDFKFDLLNKQYHQLLEENGKLKSDLASRNSQALEEGDRRIRAIREKYDSKIAELTEKIAQQEKHQSQTGGDRQELLDRIDGLLEENHQLSQANKKTQKMYVEVQQQCEGLKSQLRDTFECEKSSERSKSQDLEALLQKKTAQIQSMEENELVLKARMNAITRELEAADGEKRRCLLESKKMASVCDTLRGENSELEKTNTRIFCELEQLNRELEGFRRTKQHLEGELHRCREQEVSSLSSNQTTEMAKNRLQMLYDSCQQDLLKRKQEVEEVKQQLELQLKDGQRQEDKIRELSSKNTMLLKNINELQTELDLVSGKLSGKLKENRELDTAKGLLERQVRELEAFRIQYQQLELAEKERNQADHQLQQQDTKQRKNIELQGKIYEEEIAIMRENEQALVIRNEKLQSELKRLEMVVTSGSKQLELATSQKEAMMREISELKDALSLTKNSDHSSKTSTIKLQERLNSMEVLNQDLRTTLQEESMKVKQLNEELLRQQSDLKQKEARALVIFNENVQLSQRCQALEGTKCELYEKLKLMASHRSETEEDKMARSQEMRLMADRMAQLELELHKKNTAMLTIDQERDSMQMVLDQKTEENAQLRMRVEELGGALKRNNRQIDTRDMSMHGLQTRVSGLQQENEQLRKQHERLMLEYQSKLAIAGKMETQLNTLANEKDIMALGQRDTNRELDRLNAAYNELDRRFKQRTREYDESRENEQHMRMTHEQVLAELRDKAMQIARLEGFVKELEDANNEMFTELQERDRAGAEINCMVRSSQQQITQYMNEIASYERQLGILGNQLGIKEDQLRRVAAERDNYRLEQSRNRQPADLRMVFEERLSLVQNQLELKRRECESLHQQVRELEQVIESERTNNFVLARELNEQRTPIRGIMGSSMMDSGMENSSIHANSVSRPQMHLQESFESHGSICSRKLKERIQRIEEQYATTYIRNKARNDRE